MSLNRWHLCSHNSRHLLDPTEANKCSLEVDNSPREDQSLSLPKKMMELPSLTKMNPPGSRSTGKTTRVTSLRRKVFSISVK